MQKTFEVHSVYGGTTICTLEKGAYSNNGHIALSLWCDEGPYANITVNLEQTKRFPKNFGFVDTNNFSAGVDLIKQLGIGKPTGVRGISGWCEYPLYEFDEEAIDQYLLKMSDVIKEE